MLKLIIGILCISMSMPLFANETKSKNWQALRIAYFEDKAINQDARQLLLLEAPKRAEDPAIVPIRIKSVKPQTPSNYIKALHIIIDNNPMAYTAKLSLADSLEQIDISTRVRVDRYTHLRIIAEKNDGSLHMVKQFVKASGGCSAPAGKDAAAALARIGKVQIRMRDATIGEVTTAQVMVSHPNNSGLQLDQVTRGYIPAHFVKEMNITYDEKPLIKMEAGISISEDPSLRFVFTPTKSAKLTAEIKDSKGQQFYKEKML